MRNFNGVNQLIWWFGISVVAGVLISLVTVHIGSINPDVIASGSSSPDLDKAFVEQFADRIKWLETLAYAALVGTISLRWSRENILKHKTVSIACACLAVSLFNGYRAHDQVLQALGLHAPLMLSTRVSRLTVILQFWFLVAAIAMLASRILSVPVKALPRKELAILFLFTATSAYATGQPASSSQTEVNQKSCVNKWVTSRYGQTATESEINTLLTITVSAAQNEGVHPAQMAGCAFSDSILDYVANGAYGEYGNRDYDKFQEFASEVARSSRGKKFADNSFVRALWTMAEIWHQPRGLLRVESATSGDEVLVDGNRIGLTPFVCAFAPGKHQLQIKHSGKILADEVIDIHDGQEIRRVINN
jgi:hypothetical protein